MSKVRIALVGAGGWGWQHARVISQHPDAELCALVGRSPERTRARAGDFGVRHYLDIGEMLEKERPDLVSLCLPNKGHFDATIQVIRAGYPLFVEKPLTFDLAEADTLLEEAARRNLFFGINFNHRYAKAVQMAKQAIDAGDLGAMSFVTWRFGGQGGDCPEHENLIETQCHGFDMLEFLCGPIRSVFAEMTQTPAKLNSTMVIALQFANGAVGSLVGSYNSSYNYTDTHRVEINGDKARVLIEDTVRRYSFQRADRETAEVWQAGYFNDRDREFHRTFDFHFDEVVRSFRAGGEPPVHARAGRRAVDLAKASIESFNSGRRVAV